MSSACIDLPTFDFAARRERLFDAIGDGLAIFRAPPRAEQPALDSGKCEVYCCKVAA